METLGGDGIVYLELMRKALMLYNWRRFLLLTLNGQKQPPEVFCQKGVLKNFAKFTGKHQCQSLFFNKVAGLRPKACNFIKKEAPALVFSCEFCEIFKNTFLYRTPPVAASGRVL